MRSFNQVPETLADQLDHFDEMGGPHSAMTPPLGWAIAENTPFAYSQFHTPYGGTTNGTVIRWPKAITAKGEIRDQFHHLIDIAPTVLELAGLPQPTMVDGIKQKPLEGVSMAYTFTDAEAPSTHTVQYFEFAGNRGIYKDGWYAAALHKFSWEPTPRSAYEDDQWQLFNTDEDFACVHDLATTEPAKLKELQDTFMEEALKYNVLPLDDRFHERMNSTIAGRPDVMAGRTALTLYPGMVGMKENAFIDVKNRSSTITADLDIPAGGSVGGDPGARRRPRRLESLRQRRAAQVRLQLRRRGHHHRRRPTATGRARDPDLRLRLRRRQTGIRWHRDTIGQRSQVGTGRIERTIPFIFGTETADVGMDLYTPVTPDYGNDRQHVHRNHPPGADRGHAVNVARTQ